MKISPSILACDFSNLKEDIDSIINYVDYLHIDIMDGKFVDNVSFGTDLIKDIRGYYKVIFDVHLMIEDPLKHIDEYASAGSDIITFHYESKSDIQQTINKIKSLNKKVGLSINPSTTVDSIKPFLSQIDLVLVMSVEPGKGGQIFQSSSLNKMKRLSELKKENNLTYDIEVDGGVNDKTIKQIKEHGATMIVSGSYIFNATNRKEKIDSLK